jgi:hypothetical protein
MVRAFYGIGGAVTLANSVWMLLGPASWFASLPAGVPETGPFNAHFVRDIGAFYAVAAFGFAWCARHPDRSYPVHVGLALFFGAHALVHVADLLGGRLPAHHWLLDVPTVFVPAVLLAVLALPRMWRGTSGSSPRPGRGRGRML